MTDKPTPESIREELEQWEHEFKHQQWRFRFRDQQADRILRWRWEEEERIKDLIEEYQESAIIAADELMLECADVLYRKDDET